MKVHFSKLNISRAPWPSLQTQPSDILGVGPRQLLREAGAHRDSTAPQLSLPPWGPWKTTPAASPRGAEVARTRLGSGASAQHSPHVGNPDPAPPHRGETGGGAASPPTATSRSHPPRGKGRGPAGPFKGQPWVETPDPPEHPGCIQEVSSWPLSARTTASLSVRWPDPSVSPASLGRWAGRRPESGLCRLGLKPQLL